MGSLCFVCDLYSHSETAHRENKKNKRITQDVSRTKSWGLVLVYPAIRVVQPIGLQKK